MIDVMENAKQDVKIGIVGKYFVWEIYYWILIYL